METTFLTSCMYNIIIQLEVLSTCNYSPIHYTSGLL